MIALGGRLGLDDVVDVANGAQVGFLDEARTRVQRARDHVERVVSEGRTVYGVTTGFGASGSTGSSRARPFSAMPIAE